MSPKLGLNNAQKQQFVITHTIRQIEIPTLPDS